MSGDREKMEKLLSYMEHIAYHAAYHYQNPLHKPGPETCPECKDIDDKRTELLEEGL